MDDYTVHWEIDVSATSPQDAALFARDIQRDPQAYAGHFAVLAPSGTVTQVDLDALDTEAASPGD